MAIKLVPKFTKKQITAALTRKAKAIEEAVLLNLQRIGEQFVINARETDTYKDRTGNLRSSIGYVILRNGKQIHSGFEDKGGPDGVARAKAVIADAVEKFPKGFVLICVAGMEYAAAVESKGLDVLTGSSQIATVMLKTAIDRIKRKTA